MELNPNEKIRKRKPAETCSKHKPYHRPPAKFECKKCGLCCQHFGEEGMNYRFAVFEWEAEFLEKKAKEMNIELDIQPESGFSRDNIIIVDYFIWKIQGKCPFYDDRIGCTINSRKPIACATYPYGDESFSKGRNWRCYSEYINHKHPKRQSKLLKQMNRLPKIIRESTLILRRIIEIRNNLLIISPGEYKKKFSEQQLNASNLIKRNLFSESTRLGILNPIFLESMKNYSFDSKASNSQIFHDLREKMVNWRILNCNSDDIFSQ